MSIRIPPVVQEETFSAQLMRSAMKCSKEAYARISLAHIAERCRQLTDGQTEMERPPDVYEDY